MTMTNLAKLNDKTKPLTLEEEADLFYWERYEDMQAEADYERESYEEGGEDE